MSEGKRYYWLKLYDDFFGSIRIKRLRRMAGGDTYLIIYLKLQLKAMKNNGVLEWKGYDKSIIEELALDLDESTDNIAITLSYLKSCGLAESSDDERFFFPFSVENVGSECSSAKRVREYRERAKLEGDTKSVTLYENGNGEKEIEKRDREDTRVCGERFARFWSAYPKKVGKGAAERAFAKYKPDDDLTDRMIKAVEQAKRSDQWRKDGGQFIPNPATWLNQKRWEDEVPDSKVRAPADDRGLEDWGVWTQ